MRNEVVRGRVGVPEKLSGRVDRKVLKWFGHVERMGSKRMTKRVYVGRRRAKGEREVTFKVEGWSEESVRRKRDGLRGS